VSIPDRRALDAIAKLLNARRHPNDIAAALMLLVEVGGRVRETGRRVSRQRHRRRVRIVPRAEQQLRDAVLRLLRQDYDVPTIAHIVLDAQGLLDDQ
jgi:fructose-1,6-bisphosphatase/inositol monophosphatase family enzyme